MLGKIFESLACCLAVLKQWRHYPGLPYLILMSILACLASVLLIIYLLKPKLSFVVAPLASVHNIPEA
jgi:hypothetical protein